MTSFPEANDLDDCHSVSKQNESCNKSNEVKNTATFLSNMNSEKGISSISEEMNYTENNRKPKKNSEVCGTHAKVTAGKTELQIVTENVDLSSSLQNEFNPEKSVRTTDTESKQQIFSNQLANISSSLQCYDSNYNLPNISRMLENEKIDDKIPSEEFFEEDIIYSSSKDISGHISPRQNFAQAVNLKSKPIPFNQEEDISQHLDVDSVLLSISAQDIPETNSQSALPDILSTLNKPATNGKTQDPNSSSNRLDSVDLEKERGPKSKSLVTQTSYLPNFLSSEALHDEMEMELKQLKRLHSLQANQSIYKLAYDENVTDQSEADSMSPSPESQVPSSLASAEILIHEADSGSDAGSEDVELLPHRYESETFRNENKHVYVNKLSLAVELLRTHESLPYDDEFKRVEEENSRLANNKLPGVHTGGKVNLGFVEDINRFSIKNHFENNSASASTSKNVKEVVSQFKHSTNRNSDTRLDNLDDELCEEALAQSSKIQENTEEIKAEYRRFGVRVQHYFSPGAAFSLNPCLCCVIM